jgi:cold shock CspA family protein
MQATVRSFDADTRTGSLLLDDGSELSFDADAVDRGGLRLLRPGQRVRLDTSASTGAVDRLRI